MGAIHLYLVCLAILITGSTIGMRVAGERRLGKIIAPSVCSALALTIGFVPIFVLAWLK